MGKNLVIVESPAKAKTIAKYLDDSYIVKASMGHVSDLPLRELGVDVENNFKPQYSVTKDKEKTVADLRKDAKDADCVWLATDEDREGEAIAWHILNELKLKDNRYQRIVFHEITKNAILKAIETPRRINQPLVDAQQARRVIDRLVGYKLSPLLWKKIQKGLSAGRVQSVTVRFIVEREEEIRAFKPEEFWRVKGIALNDKKKKIPVVLEKISKKKLKASSEADVLTLLKNLLGDVELTTVKSKKDMLIIDCKIPTNYGLIVDDVIKKTNKKSPPPPFTTSTLQQEAHRKFGFPVKTTMMIAQQLYEGIDLKGGRVGLITYMRTDSVNLADEALTQIKQFVGKQFGDNYTLSSPRKYKTSAKGAQEAHEAIRPVDSSVMPDSLESDLTPQQYKLYTLIWKRTVATQMQEAIIENTDITLNPEDKPDYTFLASGKVIKFDGFMKLYTEDTDDDPVDDDDEEAEVLLPAIEKGERLVLAELKSLQNFTRPPSRYTEASLVKKLESEGIGRPSTYAPTISTVISRGYIEKDKKFLIPTDLAFVVNKFLCEYFKDIVDYKFTANIEERFDDIAAGEQAWVDVVKHFYVPFDEQLSNTAKNAKRYSEETEETCPQCQNPLVIKMSRYGRFYSCSNYPECKYTRNIEGEKRTAEAEPGEPTNEICPQCGKEMVYKNGRFGRFMACSAYPECKYIKKTQSVIREAGCPKCKGDIIEKKTRKGKPFYGCKNYPKCDYAVWKKEDLPSEAS